MPVFVKTLSDIVALFLQALRLAVVLPSIILVGLNLTFVWPLFEDIPALQRWIGEDISTTTMTILAVFLTLLSSYILVVLNIPIIRFFEGYPLLPTKIGKRLQVSNHRRVQYLQQQIENLDKKVRSFEADVNEQSGDELVEIRQAELERNAFNLELSWLYPHHQTWRILPTRLGNVIAAAEEYSGHLYGLDSVVFWPFLAPILERKGYAPFIEREKAVLDFLLNMSVVSLFFGCELVYIDLLLSRWNLPMALLEIGIASVIGFCFYLLSIQGALGWGYTIRTSFVLFKDDLGDQLGLKRAEDYYEERVQWKRASRFFRDHDVTPGRYVFDYTPEKWKRRIAEGGKPNDKKPT